MAINVNVQGFVDNIVAKMQETDIDRAAIKVVTAQFDETINGVIDLHTRKIAELKAETNGSTVNAAAISYHEKKLAYYMS